MADQVMTVDGNFKPYVEGARKAEEATKKVGKSAASIGDQFSNALVKIDLLKMGLLKVNQIIEQVNALNKGASVSRDDRAHAVGTAAGSLGVDPYKIAAIIENRKGAGSKDVGADVSFLAALASMNKGRPAPLSGEDSLDALSSYHATGDYMTGQGGGDFISLLGKGHTPKSAMAELAKSRKSAGFYEPMGKGLYRSNSESGRAIESEGNRGAAGDEARSFSDFAAKRAEQSTLNQIYEFLTPDPLEKVMYDARVKWNNMQVDQFPSLSGMNGMKRMSPGYGNAGGDSTEAFIQLNGAINRLSDATGAAVTKPNGAVEVK
jgi:hypothetical protein